MAVPDSIDDIKPGTRLYIGDPRDAFNARFVADVRGVTDRGIQLSAPVRDDEVLELASGQVLSAFLQQAGRLYRVETRVLEAEGEPAHSVTIEHPSSVVKTERREFYRLMTRIEPRLCARYDRDDPEQLVVLGETAVLDVSGGGARIRTADEVRDGDRLHLAFLLDEDPGEVAIDADVLRVVPPPGGRRFYQVHCRWADAPRPLIERIVRFVFRQQVAETGRKAG